MLGKAFTFIKNVAKAVINTIKEFVEEVVLNAESTIILVTSAVGITAILTELPFQYALPAIIDAPFVIPVLSTFIVYGLILMMQYRNHSSLDYVS